MYIYMYYIYIYIYVYYIYIYIYISVLSRARPLTRPLSTVVADRAVLRPAVGERVGLFKTEM